MRRVSTDVLHRSFACVAGDRTAPACRRNSITDRATDKRYVPALPHPLQVSFLIVLLFFVPQGAVMMD